MKINGVVTLNAFTRVAAVADGVTFERLVVIFLKRAPRWVKAAKVGAL